MTFWAREIEKRAHKIWIGGLVWRVRQDVELTNLEVLLENPNMFLAHPEKQFKSSRVVTIARVPSLAPGAPNLVVRRLNYGKWVHRVRDWIRPSRARRAFLLGIRLLELGVATPKPVAVAERRSITWPQNAYLVTEEIPRAETLGTYLARVGAPPPRTVRQLAHLLARLHNVGFSHRDLKSGNVLLNNQGPWLIDLDGVRYRGTISEARAVADLARLARVAVDFPEVLRVSGLRFIIAYSAERHPPLDPRNIAAKIVAQVAGRLGRASRISSSGSGSIIGK